ncbi:FAD-dependent monooxygenase [Actinomycetes bacterium KLBMP 9797]
MTRFVVAGGGVAGLAAALALTTHGHRIVVLERGPEFTEIGAGIQLAANAFDALDRLGVGARVRHRAVHVDELRFMDGITGDRVAGMPLREAYRRRFGNPYAVVHRNDLYRPLLDACRAAGSVELRAGDAVVRYEASAAGIAAVLASGGTVEGDALIGADGIRSAIRSQMLSDGPPRQIGHTIYRCLVPMAEVPAELRWSAVTLWAGPGWHVVHYPIAGSRYLNLAATRVEGAGRAASGTPLAAAQVRLRFPGLAATARRPLCLGNQWRAWRVCDRAPAPQWTDGRVVLIGDAAHPMVHYAAQGAAMALEDAVLLGDLINSSAADLPARFGEFVAARRDRTARTQLVARQMGTRLYHPAGAAATARNALLRSLSVDDLYEKVAWLHAPERYAKPSRRTARLGLRCHRPRLSASPSAPSCSRISETSRTTGQVRTSDLPTGPCRGARWGA